MVTLTEGGVLIGLILLGYWLWKHIRNDEESRSKMYNRIDSKFDEVRKELKADIARLDEKFDKLAEAVARLEGYHQHQSERK